MLHVLSNAGEVAALSSRIDDLEEVLNAANADSMRCKQDYSLAATNQTTAKAAVDRLTADYKAVTTAKGTIASLRTQLKDAEENLRSGSHVPEEVSE